MTPGAEKMGCLKNQGLCKESAFFLCNGFKSNLNTTGFNIVIYVNRIGVV